MKRASILHFLPLPETVRWLLSGMIFSVSCSELLHSGNPGICSSPGLLNPTETGFSPLLPIMGCSGKVTNIQILPLSFLPPWSCPFLPSDHEQCTESRQ